MSRFFQALTRGLSGTWRFERRADLGGAVVQAFGEMRGPLSDERFTVSCLLDAGCAFGGSKARKQLEQAAAYLESRIGYERAIKDAMEEAASHVATVSVSGTILTLEDFERLVLGPFVQRETSNAAAVWTPPT